MTEHIFSEGERRSLGAHNATQQVNLCSTLRTMRGQRGLPAQQVAADMGVSTAALRHLEMGGANPSMSVVRSWAKAVGATLTFDASMYDTSKNGDTNG